MACSYTFRPSAPSDPRFYGRFSPTLASHPQTQAEYTRTVEAFHETAKRIADAAWGDPACQVTDEPKYLDKRAVSPRGDEICVIASRLSLTYEEFDLNLLSRPIYDEWISRNLLAAIKFALALKSAWLVSKYNVQNRILRGRLPLDLAVGMHIGPVAFIGSDDRDVNKAEASQFIGHSVNLAKRIESTARDGEWTSIMVSPEVRHVARHSLPHVLFHVHRPFELKGILRPPRVAEVREVLFHEHYKPKNWSDDSLKGVNVDAVTDALGLLVGWHVEALGFRFIAAMALSCCNMGDRATQWTSERLLQRVVNDADEYSRIDDIEECYNVLSPHYDILRGVPMVERMLYVCAVRQKRPRVAAIHSARISWRLGQYFDEFGVWTKGPAST